MGLPGISEYPGLWRGRLALLARLGCGLLFRSHPEFGSPCPGNERDLACESRSSKLAAASRILADRDLVGSVSVVFHSYARLAGNRPRSVAARADFSDCWGFLLGASVHRGATPAHGHIQPSKEVGGAHGLVPVLSDGARRISSEIYRHRAVDARFLIKNARATLAYR